MFTCKSKVHQKPASQAQRNPHTQSPISFHFAMSSQSPLIEGGVLDQVFSLAVLQENARLSCLIERIAELKELALVQLS